MRLSLAFPKSVNKNKFPLAKNFAENSSANRGWYIFQSNI